MTIRMRELADEIIRLQLELDREIEQRRQALGWKLRDGLVKFEHGLAAEQRRFRTGAVRFLAASTSATNLSAPIIYSMIVPLLLLDAGISFYQAVCFRAYRIPRVRRADYIALDRHHLAYLNWIEAINCAFCGYSNGVIAYAREIASRTEQYWCPIKHALRVSDPHQRYYEFLEYGEASTGERPFDHQWRTTHLHMRGVIIPGAGGASDGHSDGFARSPKLAIRLRYPSVLLAYDQLALRPFSGQTPPAAPAL